MGHPDAKFLTLTIRVGRIVHVGDHILELASSSSDGIAVVRWTRPDGESGLEILEHPEALAEGAEWLELDSRSAVSLSRRARPQNTQARLTFRAPESVEIWRDKGGETD